MMRLVIDMDQIKMGQFISELRKEKGLTQKDIGDKLNITDNSVSKWERGINAPDIYYLGPLSEILGVSVKELLNGERNIRKRKIKKADKKIVLETKNLSKNFGNKKILKAINMKIYEGDIVGLIGPNGAGKTTFIKTILNLYKEREGEVFICGINIDQDFEKAISNVGCVIENPDLYPHLSGYKNIKIVSLLNNIKDDEYIEKIVKLFKLNARIKDKVKKYSLGMKQRLGIVCALIKKPKLLILDEPTNGLDPLGIKELRDIIKNISEDMNVTVLISSHILSEIENICDRIVIIDNGYIIDEIDIDDMKSHEISLEQEFLKLTSGTVGQIGGEL